MLKKYSKYLVLFSLILSLCLISACAKGGALSEKSDYAKLGDAFTSRSMNYTFSVSPYGNFLQMEVEDISQLSDSIGITTIIYPNSMSEKVIVRNMAFEYTGEKYLFVLPFTEDSLPLRVDYQESYSPLYSYYSNFYNRNFYDGVYYDSDETVFSRSFQVIQ